MDSRQRVRFLGDTVNGAGLGDRLGEGIGLLGGVQSITEADAGSPGGQVTFLRQMDAITAGGASNDNRRTYFMKDLATLPGFTPTFMDDGVTITFRARLTPTRRLKGRALSRRTRAAPSAGMAKECSDFARPVETGSSPSPYIKRWRTRTIPPAH